MSDILTPEERAAIDAFPPDRIQRIEGPIARPAPYVWSGDPRSAYQLGKLVPTEPMSNGERLATMKRQMWADKRSRAAASGNHKSTVVKRLAMDARRPRVAELREAGKSLDEIAAAVGVSRTTVKDDLRAMRAEQAKRMKE